MDAGTNTDVPVQDASTQTCRDAATQTEACLQVRMHLLHSLIAGCLRSSSGFPQADWQEALSSQPAQQLSSRHLSRNPPAGSN